MSLRMESVDESLLLGPDGPPARQDGVYVRFHFEPVLNTLKSWGGKYEGLDGKEVVVVAAGRPVYDDVEYIEILTPGDKTNIVNRPVREQDRRQFARQYAAWKSGDTEQLSGTPLAAWPPCSRSQVEELKHFQVRTVEQLAALSDTNLQNIGPLRALRQQAQDYLAAAKGSAHVTQMRAESDALRNEVSALREQLRSLAEAAQKQKSKQ